MKKRSLLFALLLAFAALAAAGCGGTKTGTNTTGGTTSAPTETPYQTQGVTHTGNKVTVTMDLSNFKLTPSKVVVKKGDVVTFNVTNKAASTPHDVVIPDLGASAKSKILNGGETQSFTFTADKTGTFDMYCDIPGHKEAGMDGSFVVVQ